MAAAIALSTASAHAAVIEDWQFGDAADTALNAVANAGPNNSSLGAAATSGNVTTDGAGNLRFSVGADASDNLFRNSNSALGLSTGTVTLSFTYSDASITGGDASGANVGFGFREEGTNTDLFAVRLQKQSGSLRLQTRIAGSNTNLENFGTDTLAGPLAVTAVANLDTDLLDVSWSINGGTVSTATGIAITDATYDFLRTAANLNTTDFGANDTVGVDFITVDYVVPEPASLALVALGGLSMLGRRRKSL
ncbi:MAG: PEP-CTERM sorting domain-containing protein [Planctomycetota bacterium]